MVVIYIGLLIPFSIYLLVNFFATIPRSLEEAARIDGAGSLRMLVRVVVPLSAPAIVTVVVVNAVWVWNELLIALVFLQDDDAPHADRRADVLPGPLPVERAARDDRRPDRDDPDAALYIVGQRFFIRGLSTGFGK